MMDHCRVIDLVRRDGRDIVAQDVTLRDVAEQFLLSECELLAVTDSHGRFAGVVSESSVVRGLLNTATAPVPLTALVNRHVDSIRTDIDVNQVLHLFRSSCHSAIPAVDENNVVCGMLRRRQVMKYLMTGRIDQPHADAQQQVRRAQPKMDASSGDSVVQQQPNDAASNVSPRPWFLRGRAARERLMRPDEGSGSL